MSQPKKPKCYGDNDDRHRRRGELGQAKNCVVGDIHIFCNKSSQDVSAAAMS